MLCLAVSNQKESSQFTHADGPIVLGRAPKVSGATHTIQDDYCSAHQLRVEAMPGSQVNLTNMSTRVPVELSDGSKLDPGTTLAHSLPVRMNVGRTVIEIKADSGPDPYQTIAQPIALSVRSGLGLPGLREVKAVPTPSGEWTPAKLSELSDVPSVDQLTRWFETVVTIQQSAASSDEFFEETARAVVNLIGLDCGMILTKQDGLWKPAVCYPPELRSSIALSQPVLEKVCRQRRTYFKNRESFEETTSLAGASTLVASPIFGNDGKDVVGMVYGVLFNKLSRFGAAIRPLEAQLVQVLAAAIGAGLARRESELEAARRHVQFEQFFSQELARQLDADPSLLDGQDREVTILVSDVRGFSRIAERLGPRETCRLMNDFLECLTQRIHEEGGVVVDYIGDGIMAMWNAPVDQPDHVARACRAALAMQGELPGLNSRWQERIGSTLALGIGINTGPALVGNTGCPRKFKYGPLGHTVNLASRTEGATKYLGVPTLITGPTHEQLRGAFATRRLCRVRVVGIDGPVDFHELHAAEIEPAWASRRESYEAALTLFESGKWSEACKALYPLLAGQEKCYDLPSLTLIGRAIECLKTNPSVFDPVVALHDK